MEENQQISQVNLDHWLKKTYPPLEFEPMTLNYKISLLTEALGKDEA